MRCIIAHHLVCSITASHLMRSITASHLMRRITKSPPSHVQHHRQPSRAQHHHQQVNTCAASPPAISCEASPHANSCAASPPAISCTASAPIEPGARILRARAFPETGHHESVESSKAFQAITCIRINKQKTKNKRNLRVKPQSHQASIYQASTKQANQKLLISSKNSSSKNRIKQRIEDQAAITAIQASGTVHARKQAFQANKQETNEKQPTKPKLYETRCNSSKRIK
jgi:hypothetical protein